MERTSTLQRGLVGKASQIVTAEDTASSLGSGLVAAFSTPKLLALIENASVAAVKEHIPGNRTTVGVEVHLKHIAATPVGMRVHAESELVEVRDRKLVFKADAWDEKEKICEASHTRVVVYSEHFEQRLKKKATQESNSSTENKI
jgi:fluoroacetyl-CoA thioesterase